MMAEFNMSFECDTVVSVVVIRPYLLMTYGRIVDMLLDLYEGERRTGTVNLDWCI